MLSEHNKHQYVSLEHDPCLSIGNCFSRDIRAYKTKLGSFATVFHTY